MQFNDKNEFFFSILSDLKCVLFLYFFEILSYHKFLCKISSHFQFFQIVCGFSGFLDL